MSANKLEDLVEASRDFTDVVMDWKRKQDLGTVFITKRALEDKYRDFLNSLGLNPVFKERDERKDTGT